MASSASGTSGMLPTTKQYLSDGRKDGFDPAQQKDLFLNLLVAQLKNQDPTSPMDQKEMMGQMAQMTSVEQMANMSRSIEQMQNFAMIGKTVDFNDTSFNPPLLVTGAKVDGVSLEGGNTRIMLDSGQRIEAKQIVAVR